MPRAPRIEFEGAVHHVMARGNRREPIVFGDDDRELFVETFGEACERTGWEVFAWTLMDNHYHAVFRTPQANLVEGMKWMQNAFTRRLNARHRLWGHLFGGRYRSWLVEADHGNENPGGNDYLTTVIDYIHLSPGRAKLVDGVKKSLREYPWSSLASAYAVSPRRRPPWMAVTEGLGYLGEADTAAGRRRYVGRLDAWVAEERGDPEVDGVSLGQRMERGWYWGSEAFRDRMLALRRPGEEGAINRTYQSSTWARDHGEGQARTILEAALKHYGMEAAALQVVERGDWKRASVAWVIARDTSVPQAWIAEHLGLHSPANVSQQIRRFAAVPDQELPVVVRKWKRLKLVE